MELLPTLLPHSIVFVHPCHQDWRGVRWTKRHLWVSLVPRRAGAASVLRPWSLLELSHAHASSRYSETYVLPGKSDDREVMSLGALPPRLKMPMDLNWPATNVHEAHPNHPRVQRIIKRSRHPETLAGFGRSYLSWLAKTNPRKEFHDCVDRLRITIVRIANELIDVSSYFKSVGAESGTMIGSIARGTYNGRKIDFDLLISTALRRDDLDKTQLRDLSDKLIGRVARLPIMHEFCRLAYGRRARITPSLFGFGVRGKNSFVVRYALALPGDAAAGGGCQPFLDVNFGNLPQLIGYERSIQIYFTGLSAKERRHLQQEIRFARLVLQGFADLYGSRDKAFRAHVVEQLIIQAYDYRSSGYGVGSFLNALQLLLDEATCPLNDTKRRCSDLGSFTERFPLWHPGWLDQSVISFGDRRRVDLWSILGDGHAPSADSKWKMLISLASSLNYFVVKKEEWSVPSLLLRARSIMNSVRKHPDGGFTFATSGGKR